MTTTARPYRMRRPMPTMAGVARLERLAREGAEHQHWYRDAAEEVERAAWLLQVHPFELADLLALTSPRVTVTANIRATAKYFLLGEKLPDGMVPGTYAAHRNWDTTGSIRGPKTSNFARAISGDEDAVVLDVWMARAFRIPQERFEVPGIYAECERRIRRVARKLGMTPAGCQSAIWHAMAMRKPGEPQRDRSDKRYVNAPRFNVLREVVFVIEQYGRRHLLRNLETAA